MSRDHDTRQTRWRTELVARQLSERFELGPAIGGSKRESAGGYRSQETVNRRCRETSYVRRKLGEMF